MQTQQPLTAYLVDTVTRERLAFQYNPNEIVDSKSTTYATLVVPGMSHPRYQYVAGDARKITFTVTFYKGDVRRQVAWLQALLYPTHQGTMLQQAPHPVLFFFGELYPGIACLVREVRAHYAYLFDPATLQPQRADVEITLEELVSQSVNAREVRR
ncbi:MAG: hypothetical protein BWY76_02162 [bacterium ADurb.Bin429]|nr:MAG: hypothetical protein BWY76_02162 [bacterium ADurb.Bin429]